MLTIKDYALFLGCDCYVLPSDTVKEWLPEKLKELPTLQYNRKLTLSNLEDTFDNKYFPVLRRIQDITPQERVSAIKCNMSSADDWIAKANRTKYLIEIGVDVFGWIDKGLALDKKLFPIIEI